MKVAIVGAGIGGLTTAIALTQKGINVEVYEASSKLSRVGAGISLALNAMQVLQRLGLDKKIEYAGEVCEEMRVTDHTFKKLSAMPLDKLSHTVGVNSVVIHRGDLQQLLLEELQEVPVHTGATLERIEQKEDGVHFSFKGGIKQEADLLVGADGIHSAVRRHLFPSGTVRDAGQMCWRGLADRNRVDIQSGHLIEMWGKGVRFGFTPINSREIYWFAVAPKGRLSIKNGLKSGLLELFSMFSAQVPDMIKATEEDQILSNALLDLKPLRHWYRGRVCLLGDAAHATTPNMGQGACQAIESALALSNCLDKSRNDVEKAFANFQHLRYQKANEIVSSSFKIGKLAHVDNPVGIALRNTLMRCIPDAVSARQTQKILCELTV